MSINKLENPNTHGSEHVLYVVQHGNTVSCSLSLSIITLGQWYSKCPPCHSVECDYGGDISIWPLHHVPAPDYFTSYSGLSIQHWLTHCILLWQRVPWKGCYIGGQWCISQSNHQRLKLSSQPWNTWVHLNTCDYSITFMLQSTLTY